MSGYNAASTAATPKNFITLRENTAAIQISTDAQGRIRLGTLLQLPSGATLEVTGAGFDDRTARVSWEGSSYYVFLEREEGMRPRTRAQSA